LANGAFSVSESKMIEGTIEVEAMLALHFQDSLANLHIFLAHSAGEDFLIVQFALSL
jgi:hypothetical protein